MKCRVCGSFMVVDDRNKHSCGNIDICWVCLDCSGSCIQQIRNFRSVSELWHFENDVIENYIIPLKRVY